jgi:seryl-tRNA synthetase
VLDIELIREKTEEVEAALLKRMDSVDFTELLAWDRERRALIAEGDGLKAERNRGSAQIPILKKEGKDVEGMLEEMKQVSERVKELDGQRARVESKIREFLANLPNIPAADVPAGGKENNRELRVWGEQPEFDFEFRDHVDLVESLGLIDYARGVKLGGSGFWLYRGDGARLEWALLNYFVDAHLADGYEFVLPPHLLNYECGFAAGQFPKFADDVFQIAGDSGQFLLPTAETALINLHRDEILRDEELPRKYFAYTPCYRKEAGGYRTEERGMIRGHQFNKVELFQFTRSEDSQAALEELVGKAEALVRGLGLHHRVSRLAAEDCSAAMAETLDIEVWIPSMGGFKEVSSASSARDYQARRGNIRFKRKEGGKNEFVHTLNGSGLATSRLLPAIVEQFQRRDGSVVVPEVLRQWVGKELLLPLE